MFGCLLLGFMYTIFLVCLMLWGSGFKVYVFVLRFRGQNEGFGLQSFGFAIHLFAFTQQA